MRVLLAFSFLVGAYYLHFRSFHAAASNKQADEVSKKQAVMIAKKNLKMAEPSKSQSKTKYLP